MLSVHAKPLHVFIFALIFLGSLPPFQESIPTGGKTVNDLASPLHHQQGAIVFHKMQQLQLSKDFHFPACSGTQQVIPRKILQNEKWPTNKWTKWCLRVERGDSNVNKHGVFELNSCICTTDFQYLIITKGHDRLG